MTTHVQLTTGDSAPAFAALDQTGATRTLDEFSGSGLVLYFYPKAFTPGCTTESCDFRDRHEVFAARGMTILGVSPDDSAKLSDFKDEHDLPFDLLSDPDNVMATAYGAYGEKTNYGKTYMGIIRSTFVIDGNGKVSQAFYNVRAKGHAERVSTATVTP
ncbi:MAG: thioredoxin-dependent thiol peroxidase [Acidimicrobiia bacterium]